MTENHDSPDGIDAPEGSVEEWLDEPGVEAPEPEAAPRAGNAESTVGAGTTIALGCVAVCVVIVLIAILVLTIIS